MSLHKRGRNFRSFSGRGVPIRRNPIDSRGFAKAISAALREEYGDTHAAAKTIARLTGGNDRSAKNWLAGKNGPNGQSLIALCRHSDRVFETVARLCGRYQVLKTHKLIDAREKLRDTLAALDEIEATAHADQPRSWPSTPRSDLR